MTGAQVPPPSASNTELLRWAFDRLNEHDVTSVRACWTEDTVEYFPDATCRGVAEIAAYFEEKIAAIEGFRLDVVTISASGEDVFVRWKMSGRHVGELLGVAGTGKDIHLDGIDHFVLRDGKIATNTVVFDQLAFARQVGLLPPDGSAADLALKAAFNARTKVATRLPELAVKAWDTAATLRLKAGSRRSYRP